jgi:hypothetical protein
MISKQRQMGYVDTTTQRYIFLSAKQLNLNIDVNIVLTCSVQRLLGSPGSPDREVFLGGRSCGLTVRLYIIYV